MTSTVRTPPSKVFTFSSWGMAAMVAKQSSTRNRGRLRCVYKMRGAFCFSFPTRCTIYNKFGGSSYKALKHNPLGYRSLQDSFILQDSSFKKLLPNLQEKELFGGKPFPLLLQPTKTLGFFSTLAGLVAMACVFLGHL